MHVASHLLPPTRRDLKIGPGASAAQAGDDSDESSGDPEKRGVRSVARGVASERNARASVSQPSTSTDDDYRAAISHEVLRPPVFVLQLASVPSAKWATAVSGVVAALSCGSPKEQRA